MHAPPLHDVPLHDILWCLVLGLVIGWLWRPPWAAPGTKALCKFFRQAWYSVPLVIYIAGLIAADRKRRDDK